MYLVRNLYEKLTDWKKSNHSVLELNGLGKDRGTYFIDQFAKENFRIIIYINLLETSGRQFLACYKAAAGWDSISAFPKSQNPLYDALRMFHPDFMGEEDTVVIIDEIQESVEIYNQIHEFTGQFHCRFIIIGSYFGKIFEPERCSGIEAAYTFL